LNETVIVGAGAAGLATAIFVRLIDPTRPVRLVDGAARPGAKILVSGGSRCNVTNAVVTETDYWGGKRTIIRRVLRRLPVAETIAFFERIGVPLKEEPGGKLFPRSDRSRDVLDALLRAAADTGVVLSPSTRVHGISGERGAFRLDSSRGPLRAESVVFATGGLSLPKTGSDGGGLEIARRLGHSIVPTTPALAPLVSAGGLHAGLSGVSQDVELTIWVDGRAGERLRGSMLWTHFGISGPVALNASRHHLRAVLEGQRTEVTVSLLPDETFESVDTRLTTAARQRPKSSLHSVLAVDLPASVAAALADFSQTDASAPLAQLSREARRRLAHTLTALPLAITGSRGYNYAEATAGGVALEEIDPATMQSRRCPGIYLVGEMLDVDGRIGGFNFQWAWSSARAAAEGLCRDRQPDDRQ
jgi:predicted Rossmann fold flavoprotein